MDQAERIDAVSSFLLQSPPGEINDVLNDVRNIIADDALLQEGILPSLREYNIAQFTTVDVPETNHQSIISEAARIVAEESEERFLDPRSKTTFVFDHLTLEASKPEPYELDTPHEEARVSLEKAALTYLASHFLDGTVSVFAPSELQEAFTLQIVANKYNPTNFWSGRWRSEYLVNLSDKRVKGKILLNVHYYEQGNVQLETTHNISFNIPAAAASAAPATAASKIIALIEDEESRYQVSLNETYREMGERTFKGLRRALPLTRQKIDWDKVTGYKLGAELSSSKGVFGSS
ncbi:F-actin-capping protein subunit alpha [Coprinopsis marcescibilis]|uniref:F-actin-capping protein subunit alpha n=1 Tax=Coprinopsis marcescibilis TaxID=230819 RepID=A0A5C3L5P7_COPMA|nr:F-actin-capping protein subunit alpha [Coprinopsis marcescibilis]